MKCMSLVFMLLATMALGCGRRGMESKVSGTVTVAGKSTPGGVAPGLEHIHIPETYSGPTSPLRDLVKPGRNVIDIDLPAAAPRTPK